MTSNSLKFLLVDMELSYALYYLFPSKKPQYAPARNIKQQQFCVCAAWKWLHETSIYSMMVGPKGNDLNIAKKLHALFTEADVIIAHNGDAFDIKHANTMFRKHGLGPIPERKSIDTLKVARKYFNFAGNSLGDLLRLFKKGDKEEKPDWIRLTEGDRKEIKKAVTYCEADVLGLENIFLEMRPYIRNFPCLKPPKQKKFKLEQCVTCGSKCLQSKGLEWDGKRQYRRIKCVSCGHQNKEHIEAK